MVANPPGAAAGTTRLLAVKDPEESTRADPRVELGPDTPEKVMEAIPPGEKFDPVTVKVEPGLPKVGARPILGVGTTVNTAVAESPELPLAFTLTGPTANPKGTSPGSVNVPAELAEADPKDVPPKVTVTVSPGEKA
jgi:hypothetical protein